MTLRTAFNPTDSPVVIDDEGRTLAGLAHGDVHPGAPEVKAAVEQGRLLLDEPETAPTATKTTASKPKEN